MSLALELLRRAMTACVRLVGRGWQAFRRSPTAVLVVGALLIGCGGGYLLAGPSASETVVQLDSDQLGVVESGLTPSVVGLDVSTARLVIADAGLFDVTVNITAAGAAGTPGRVLTQVPAAGAPAGDTMQLTVATSIPVPKLMGTDYLAARDALEKLGAVVRLERQVKPGSIGGQVLATAPAEGVTMPSVVTLTIADPGEAMDLEDLDESDSSGCGSSGDVTFGTTDYSTSLSCGPDEGPAFADYPIDGKVLTFQGVAAIEDGDQPATLRVLADDKEVFKAALTAKPTAISLDLVGVKVLRFEAIGPEDSGAVVAQPRLFGTPENIAALTARS